MTPSNPTTSKRLSLISVERWHTPFRRTPVTEEGSSRITGLTLRDCFEKFRVRDDRTLLHLWGAIRFLGFPPEVGATVHAGYVEDSYALQRCVAEVQGSPAALAEAKQKRKEAMR